MKKLFIFVVLLVPVITVAENFPAMDKQQMQAMMDQAQKMQTCMKNIDQSEMQAFEQRGRKMEAEVKAMCAAGNRSEAQSKAITFSKEVAASSFIQKLKSCGDMMKGIISNLPKMMRSYEDQKDGSKHHICDEFK